MLDFAHRYPDPAAFLASFPGVARIVFGSPVWRKREEEVRAAVMFGVATAAPGFNPDKGASFDTYAACFIKGSVLDLVRFHDRDGRQFAEGDEGDGSATVEARPERNPIEWDDEVWQRVLAPLTRTQRRVLVAHLFDEAGVKTTAARLGVDFMEIRRVLRKALAKIKAEFPELAEELT
ncbi:hypothetical protein FRUB_09787 [Fimbriiglobus ruber]|uniref:RNA polymerase sigma-70 region 2 domain-containing protein n=1 Tax=Fimbriiglobus ruber TaxID=1908690 RepID=A0A225DEY1_9BACT|nr:hypothetical protein FRUB_09787 [Fimbriiglobus ruber]